MNSLSNGLGRSSVKGSTEYLESIGGWVRGKIFVFLSLSTLLYLVFKELIAERKKGFPLIFEITLRQIYFTGVEALKVVILISLALGTVIIVQAGTQLVFGLLIALTCTYHGLTVRFSSIEVPQAATRGVVSAMLFCFATNALLTVLSYL